MSVDLKLVDEKDLSECKMMRMDEAGLCGMHSKYAVVNQKCQKLLAAIDFQDGDPEEIGINGVQHEMLMQIMVDRLEMCTIETPWIKLQREIMKDALHKLQKGIVL